MASRAAPKGCAVTTNESDVRRPSIADAYQDLLAPLEEAHRRSLIVQLAQGYYEGWRPTRRQLAAVIAEDNRDRAMDDDAPAITPAVIGHGKTDPLVLAAFEVDCGELAPGYQFLARSLSNAGMVKRGTELCRLAFLNYELRPMASAAEHPPFPMIFTAPITCCPDQSATWADGDGQGRHHTVTRGRVIARRGPWPIPATVQRIRFMINRQIEIGDDPAGRTAAGVLLVDIGSGRAAWRAVPGRPARHHRRRDAAV